MCGGMANLELTLIFDSEESIIMYTVVVAIFGW